MKKFLLLALMTFTFTTFATEPEITKQSEEPEHQSNILNDSSYRCHATKNNGDVCWNEVYQKETFCGKHRKNCYLCNGPGIPNSHVCNEFKPTCERCEDAVLPGLDHICP